MGVARFLCLDGGEAYNERVITVGIGWVLLASATSWFSGYRKLAYCSSAKGAPVAQLVRASDKYSEGPGFNPQLGPDFSGFLYSLRKLSSLEEFTMYAKTLFITNTPVNLLNRLHQPW